MNATPQGLQVGPWCVDPAQNEIRRDGDAVRLEPKAIEVLVHLARHAGSVVSREELLTAVWPGVIVGDDALTQAIIKLRRALGDEAHAPKYIETISKRGYRLIAPVRSAESTPSPAGASAPRRRAAILLAAGVLIAIAALVAILHASKLATMPWPIATDARMPLPVVAVLPFSNLGGDPKRDYFTDGVTEDIIGALGRFSGIRVMSRNAVLGFKNASPPPRAIRDQLGATYIVRGSVREADGKTRVAVELSDADRGVLLWSERYDAEGAQLFEVQDRIARNIVGALHVKLTQVEREHTFAKPTDSLEAYDLVLRARELIYRVTRDTNRQAREMLARAIELSPNYAEAYVTLAHAEYRRADQGWMEDREEGMRRVELHARRALSLEDAGAHARAHAQLARVYSRQRNLDQALTEANLAVQLNPSDPVALYAQGSMLVWLGRIDEAMVPLEMARRFDPTLDDLMLPLAYYLQGRYREALADADARIARNPDVAFLHGVRTAALAQLGQTEEARKAAAQLRRISPLTKAEFFVLGFRNPEHAAKFEEGLRKAGL